jgi:hypothetical protein
MQTVQLKDVPKGEHFKRKIDAKTIWIRDYYDAGSKTYRCEDADDMNREMFLKGTTMVYIGFTY